MKRGLALVTLLVLLFVTGAFAQESLDDLEGEADDIFADLGDVTLDADAGLTPDDFFYFLDSFVERISVGDNPERALAFKEEKILEAKLMIQAGRVEEAKEALEKAGLFGEILQREVSPDIEKEARESSKAVQELFEDLGDDLSGEEWEDVRDLVEEHEEREEKIALAAKISIQIEQLCNQLAELDPLEYADRCKTDDDSPEWQRDLDKKLTREQEREAEEFFTKLSTCFENPRDCPCEDFSVKSFADACAEIVPLAAACDLDGDEEACEKMDQLPDPIDLLPPHLQGAMAAVEDKYREAEYDHHIPTECIKAGALTRKSCMKVMFEIHAPPECQEALERGEIDPSNEREAREACERLMFEAEAPEECKEAGLRDHRECELLMFKLDAPQECIKAGIDGSRRDDWRKCDAIRFKLDAAQECLDAGLDGTGRDDWHECGIIQFQLDAPQECLDAGIDGSGRDDWRKCDKIRFELEAPEYCLTDEIKNSRDPWRACDPLRFEHDAPQECLDAGITGSDRRAWDKCEKINFEANVPQECLDAGLTGDSPRDWQECDKIRFELEAPQECLDAGITGGDRNAWDKCNEITQDFHEDFDDDHGQRREDCYSDQLHICDDDGYNCRCENKEDYDKGHDDPYRDCGAVDCHEGYHCEYGSCIPDENRQEDVNCHDSQDKVCDDGYCKCVDRFDEPDHVDGPDNQEEPVVDPEPVPVEPEHEDNEPNQEDPAPEEETLAEPEPEPPEEEPQDDPPSAEGITGQSIKELPDVRGWFREVLIGLFDP